MQDMNTRLSESRFGLQHVSCCVPDECPDSGEFRVDPVCLRFWSEPRFHVWVWVRRTFHVVGSFDENTSLSWHGIYSPGSCGNSRVPGIFVVLINSIGIW